jgi:nicotinamidase-related amidase
MLHDWKITEREYARQVSRRGRLHAFEALEPATTALAVIDMVPFFSQANPYCRGIIPNINILAKALRDAGGVVAWVLPSADEPFPDLAVEFYGAEVAETFRTSGGEGELPAKLSAGLDHRLDDVFVEKSAASAFFPGLCALPQILTARDVETVIVAGTVTNVCCESSARDARTLGFRVIMAADANAARTDAEHNASLHTIYRSFGDVRPTAEILDLIVALTPAADSSCANHA